MSKIRSVNEHDDKHASDIMDNRLNFVDVARAYAIALVLFSHAMLDTGGEKWTAAHGFEEILQVVVRSGTPLFIFMFGMMLEIAYTRVARRDGFGAVRARLFKRSWQCYLGYALTAMAGVIGGYQTISQGSKTLLFLGGTHYSNVLRVYVILLLVAPLIVRLRLRFGVQSLVAIIGCVWLLDIVLLNRLDNTPFGYLTRWVGIFVGGGKARQGPSVVHGLTFALAGMIVAGGLDQWKKNGLSRFYSYAVIMLVVSLLVLVPLVATMGLTEVAKSFADFGKFRSHNHYGYYALGLALCIVTLLALAAVVPRCPLRPWTRVPLQFGQASLSSFAGGNALLALFPPGTLKTYFAGGAAVVASVGFVVFMLAAANWRRIWGLVPAGRLFAPPVRNAP